MTRLITLVLTIICMFGLCACNENNVPPPPPETYAFEAQYIRTNGYSEDRSYPYHVVIDSKEELDAYYEANKELFDLERKEVVYADTTIGFLDACDKYDDAYFEKQLLQDADISSVWINYIYPRFQVSTILLRAAS